MRALRWPALAAFVGIGLLLLLAGRVHPARAWGYTYDRTQAIAIAARQAVALGTPAGGWSTYVKEDTLRELEYYKRLHPEDTATRGFSPYTVTVLFASPDRRRSISVQLFPDGRIASWERKEAGSKSWTMKSMRSAVDAAFHLMAGVDAGQYHPITEGAATKEGLRFTWERSGAAQAFQPTIDIIVVEGNVVHAETHYTFGRDFDDLYDHRDDPMNWFSLAYLALCFMMGLAAVILYTTGSIRRRVNHRFALALSVVNVISIAAAFWLGSGLDNIRSVRIQQGSDNYLQALSGEGYTIILALLAGLAAGGGGLFVAGMLGDKWWSLRLALSSRLWSKQVGLSISAGILASPLLSAVPLIAAACIPASLWNFRDKTSLFGPHPILQSAGDLLHPTALIFFGVTFGLVWKLTRSTALRYAIVVPLAITFFVGFHDYVLAPTPAILLAAVIMAAVQIWLFMSFDLLAIVAAETALTVLNLAVPTLLQPSDALRSTGWQAIGLLGALFAGGLVLLWKAPGVDCDDAQAEPLNLQSEREELKSEFLIAQRAQREMLPSIAPLIPGFSLAASCTPAREVGGDLYDFLPLSQDRLAIAVADVSGKGVPAALYMTLTKGLLAATTQEDLDLSTMLGHINAHLCTVGQRKTFVTMALGILDPGTQSLEYARAGHNPAVWRRLAAGTTSLLNAKGLGLGITAGRVFGRTLVVEKLDLSSGDTLVFYSDGLTEAMNVNLEQFGEERLMNIVETADGLAASEARDIILKEVARFLDGVPPQDDLTLVVLHVD